MNLQKAAASTAVIIALIVGFMIGRIPEPYSTVSEVNSDGVKTTTYVHKDSLHRINCGTRYIVVR